MNTDTTTAEGGKEPDRISAAELALTRAIEIAKEVIADLTTDGTPLKYDEAASELADRIDDDPRVILAVVGPEAWQAACLSVIRKAYAGIHAHRLGETVKMRPKPDVSATKDKNRLRAATEGMLGTLMCGAQPIGLCIRPELLAQAAISERHARVYRVVAALLPNDETPVSGVVTAAKIKEIWDGNSPS